MQKGQKTRERIIEAALAAAMCRGLEGISIGALAKETGLSKSGLFRHFGSKEALQIAVIKRVTDRFGDDVIRPALNESGGVERLRSLFTHYLNWLARNGNDAGDGFHPGCPFFAIASDNALLAGPVRIFIATQTQRLRETVERMAWKAVDEGTFREDLDVSRFAFTLISLIFGFNFFRRILDDPAFAARAVDAFEDLLADAAVRSVPPSVNGEKCE